MLTKIKSPQELKNILMDWSSDPQFAVWVIRAHEYLPDKDDFLSPNFIGWWYGYLNFGQTRDDNLHYELRTIKMNGGMSHDDGVYIDNDDFDYGYIRDYPNTDYRGNGKSVLVYFNNGNEHDDYEKPKLAYMLEITPLALLP